MYLLSNNIGEWAQDDVQAEVVPDSADSRILEIATAMKTASDRDGFRCPEAATTSETRRGASLRRNGVTTSPVLERVAFETLVPDRERQVRLEV
jgi:hypothetical protein